MNFHRLPFRERSKGMRNHHGSDEGKVTRDAKQEKAGQATEAILCSSLITSTYHCLWRAGRIPVKSFSQKTLPASGEGQISNQRT